VYRDALSSTCYGACSSGNAGAGQINDSGFCCSGCRTPSAPQALYSPASIKLLAHHFGFFAQTSGWLSAPFLDGAELVSSEVAGLSLEMILQTVLTSPAQSVIHSHQPIIGGLLCHTNAVMYFALFLYSLCS
jgi:hypothetical protein